MNIKPARNFAATLLACLALSAQAANIPVDRVVAIVNDGVILESDLTSRLEAVKQNARAAGTPLPQAKTLREQVMNRLVLEEAQIQEAEKAGIRVSDRQLAAALTGIAQNNKLSLQAFRNEIIAQGQDFDTFRDQIRREIAIKQIQSSRVNKRITVSAQDIENYLSSSENEVEDNTELKLSNILVAVQQGTTPEQLSALQSRAASIRAELTQGADFAKLAITYSNAPNALKGGELGWRKQQALPAALSQALSGKPEGYISQPIRMNSGYHIIRVDGKRGGSEALVTKTLVSHILLMTNQIRNDQQAQAEIADIAQRLQNGESFSVLAEAYSDDPGSASNGGDLGWTQNGQMVPAFEEMMNRTPVGQRSEPFQSGFGWHILQVEDRKTEDQSDEIKEQKARETIREQRFNEELETWQRELRDRAFVELKQDRL